MKKLKELANINYGVSLRKAVKADADGNARIIQMRDLREDGSVNHDTVTRIQHPALKRWQLIRQGDILLCARGGNNKAALMEIESDCHIAALHLIVIRPKRGIIVPEYLLWCVNHPCAQAFFTSNATGTSLKMVGLKELKALSVPLPPLPQQRIIAAYARLALRRRALEAWISEKRQRQAQAHLWQRAQEMGRQNT